MICFRVNQRIWGGFNQVWVEIEDKIRGHLWSVMFILIHDLEITRDFSFFTSNKMHLVSTTKTELIPPLKENRNSWSTCKPFFTGLNYCTTGSYSNTSSYSPLTGDTRSVTLNVPPSICLPSTLWPHNRATEKMPCIVGLFHKPQRFAPSSNYLKQWSSTQHTWRLHKFLPKLWV